ncbi:glycoside hydrolase family 15 protein [Nocardia fluminea]
MSPGAVDDLGEPIWLVAAIQETPGGERNWDYRYTWMRDSTFTLQALTT